MCTIGAEEASGLDVTGVRNFIVFSCKCWIKLQHVTLLNATVEAVMSNCYLVSGQKCLALIWLFEFDCFFLVSTVRQT